MIERYQELLEEVSLRDKKEWEKLSVWIPISLGKEEGGKI